MTGKNGGVLTILLSVVLLVLFVFFTFGPSQFRRYNYHFLVLGLMGIFSAATGQKQWAYATVIYGFFISTALWGMFWWFGGNEQLHRITQSNCNSFFYPEGTSNPIPQRDYCKDDGYLQFLRVLAVVSYFIVPALALAVFSSGGSNGSVVPKADAAPAAPAAPATPDTQAAV